MKTPAIAAAGIAAWMTAAAIHTATPVLTASDSPVVLLVKLRHQIAVLQAENARLKTQVTQLDQANAFLYLYLIDRAILKPQEGWEYCLPLNGPNIPASGFCWQYDIDQDGDLDQDDVGLGQRCKWCRVGSKEAIQQWLGPHAVLYQPPTTQETPDD